MNFWKTAEGNGYFVVDSRIVPYFPGNVRRVLKDLKSVRFRYSGNENLLVYGWTKI